MGHQISISMSPTHKFLDISDHQAVSDEIYEYLITEVLNKKSFMYYIELPISRVLLCCPLLVDFLNKHYLTPTLMAIIVADSKEESLPIHRDNDGSMPFIRVLWPIRNCQGSRTRFWNMPDNGRLTTDSNGVIYTEFPNIQGRELIAEFELTSPVLLNVSIPHSVHPNPDLPGLRISFSMGFDRDLPISKSLKAWFGFQR